MFNDMQLKLVTLERICLEVCVGWKAVWFVGLLLVGWKACHNFQIRSESHTFMLLSVHLLIPLKESEMSRHCCMGLGSNSCRYCPCQTDSRLEQGQKDLQMRLIRQQQL